MPGSIPTLSNCKMDSIMTCLDSVSVDSHKLKLSSINKDYSSSLCSYDTEDVNLDMLLKATVAAVQQRSNNKEDWLTSCCNCTKSCNLRTMATQWLGLGLG